MCLPSDF
ncbi:hypothetical protein YPPY09_0272, partial [Yersinia pestis PY-09]